MLSSSDTTRVRVLCAGLFVSRAAKNFPGASLSPLRASCFKKAAVESAAAKSHGNTRLWSFSPAFYLLQFFGK